MFVNDYSIGKEELIKKIEAAKNKFYELGETGPDVSDAINKFDKAIEKIDSDILSIVLIGAFSDGKTSIIAGWLNEKLDNMKISSDESSDEILCYVPNSISEGCQIVDTPGLFGDKIGSDEDGKAVSLSGMTEKYLSEADLILYVVPAKNPLKDSHKAIVNRLFNELQKIESTIFVINRMDDVADTTDEEEFAKQSEIKTAALRKKLTDFGISQNKASEVNVVCVSASPNGKDVDEWKDNREEYLRRSHINDLEEKTYSIIEKKKKQLIAKTGCDILNDEFTKKISEIDRSIDDLTFNAIPEIEKTLKRGEKDLDKYKERTRRNQTKVLEEILTLEKEIKNKIRAATMENFREVLEDEIGVSKGADEIGYQIDRRINMIFMNYSDENMRWSSKLENQFKNEQEKLNSKKEKLLSKSGHGSAQVLKKAGNAGTDTIKNVIFKTRDTLFKSYKFKPWQVVKMAKFAEKALPIAGAAIDVGTGVAENIMMQKRINDFEEKKNKLIAIVSELFKGVSDAVEDSYFENFTKYPEYENYVEEQRQELSFSKEYVEKLEKWRNSINLRDYNLSDNH